MKLIQLSILTALTLFSSCAGLEKITLFQGNKKKPVGVAALSYHQGDLTALDWKTKKGDNVIQKGSNIILNKVSGANRNTVLELDVEDLDFRGDLAVVILARVTEGKSTKLRLELIDDEGHIANGKDLSRIITVTDGYAEYVFKTLGSFTQLSPEIADVNAGNIKKIRFVYAPTRKNYTSTIDFAEMKIRLGNESKKKKGGVKGKNGGMIADFSKGKTKGWMTTGAGLSIGKSKHSLRLEARNIGPQYQSVSKKIELIDLSNHQLIRVRAKVTASTIIPFLRLDFTDVNGAVTNKFPRWVALDTIGNASAISSGNGGYVVKDGEVIMDRVDLSEARYIDYFFDLKGRFSQSYPKPLTLDIQRINKLSLFINPGFIEFSGNVYIQQIEAIERR